MGGLTLPLGAPATAAAAVEALVSGLRLVRDGR
jgi:hypothetical protein